MSTLSVASVTALDSNTNLSLTTANGSLVIANNGNIGVGTSTPNAAFSVERNTNENVSYTIKNFSPGNTVSGQATFGAFNSNNDIILIGIRPKNWGDGTSFIYSTAKDLRIVSDAGAGSFSGNTTDSSVGSIYFETSSNSTNYNTAMRIAANGNIGIAGGVTNFRLSVYNDESIPLYIAGNAPGVGCVYTDVTNTTFNNYTHVLNNYRTASTAYSFIGCWSGNFADLKFNFRGDGNAFADGAFTGGGADYAEYFEWSDGNPDNEDRRGYSVVLDGSDKIRISTANDAPSAIIGVISAMPAVVGDAAWNKWNQKYLHDDFGSYILEDYEVWEWEEEVLKEQSPSRPSNTEPQYETKTVQYVSDEIPETVYVPDTKRVIVQQRRKLNPEYNPEIDYVPREQRPEWDTVGLMGKLRLRKGQPVGDRWIKMRDVSDDVEEWLVR
jgi:hypothetical protein